MPSPKTRRRSPKRASSPARARSIFINCPFDDDYQPLLRAICFTALACGFTPRCALEFSDSGSVRFQKIVRLVGSCSHSIHDISRVELDKDSSLPRFNMPLELGADLGLRLGGGDRHRRRKTLVLDAEKHRYDKMLSDISGMDIEAHGNDVGTIIKCVRDWLNANRRSRKPLPGAAAIAIDFELYRQVAPLMVKNLKLDAHEKLHHGDFLHVVTVALPLIEQGRAIALQRLKDSKAAPAP